MVSYNETKSEPIDHYVIHVLDRGKNIEVTTYYRNRTTLKKTYSVDEIKNGDENFFQIETDSGEKLFSISWIENYRELRANVRHIFGIDLPMPKE